MLPRERRQSWSSLISHSGPSPHHASIRDCPDSLVNSTRTPGPESDTSTEKPGAALANCTTTSSLLNEIAVVPPMRLKVRTCAAGVGLGGGIVGVAVGAGVAVGSGVAVDVGGRVLAGFGAAVALGVGDGAPVDVGAGGTVARGVVPGLGVLTTRVVGVARGADLGVGASTVGSGTESLGVGAGVPTALEVEVGAGGTAPCSDPESPGRSGNVAVERSSSNGASVGAADAPVVLSASAPVGAVEPSAPRESGASPWATIRGKSSLDRISESADGGWIT